MAQVLRSVFGRRMARRGVGRMARSRVGRSGIRSIGRMARSRAGRSAGRSIGRSAGRRMMRSCSGGLFNFGKRGHRRGAGGGRMGLLASLGALVLGGIFGGRRYMNRSNHRIGGRDVSRSQGRQNVPTADY